VIYHKIALCGTAGASAIREARLPYGCGQRPRASTMSEGGDTRKRGGIFRTGWMCFGTRPARQSPPGLPMQPMFSFSISAARFAYPSASTVHASRSLPGGRASAASRHFFARSRYFDASQVPGMKIPEGKTPLHSKPQKHQIVSHFHADFPASTPNRPVFLRIVPIIYCPLKFHSVRDACATKGSPRRSSKPGAETASRRVMGVLR
jgi:hypothetical protein